MTVAQTVEPGAAKHRAARGRTDRRYVGFLTLELLPDQVVQSLLRGLRLEDVLLRRRQSVQGGESLPLNGSEAS
jgi:hypothetical protein